MSGLVVFDNRIPAMSADAIEKTRELEAEIRKHPQVELETSHVLHAGMYARTVHLPAGVLMTGVFIRVPTTLIFSGHATVNAGEEPAELVGFHVIAASAGRRQVFITHADSDLTMVFPTRAKTIEEAENEFTDEAHLLASRGPDAHNSVIITGE